MKEYIIDEPVIEVIDKDGNRYTIRTKDLKATSIVETKSKRGPKFWGRVAKTFKEIPERMNKWYENTVNNVKENIQNRNDKKFASKTIEEMEKDISINRDKLNDLINNEVEKLKNELKEINKSIDEHTKEINNLQVEEAKLEKEDEQYYYYSSEIKRVNQELNDLDQILKSRLAEFKEKQEKALTNSDLRDELVILEQEIYKLMGDKKRLEVEKQTLVQDKNSYLKEHELTADFSNIDKLNLARFDLNEEALKIDAEIRNFRAITLDNIDIMLPNVQNVKIQKLYQELKREENIRDMKIREQEEIIKNIKIGGSEPNEIDTKQEENNDSLEEVTSAVLEEVAENIGAEVSDINGQNAASTPTATVETVSSNADTSLQFDEPLQFSDDNILKSIDIPPFNPEDASQSQPAEHDDDIHLVVEQNNAEVVEESIVASEIPSEETVVTQEIPSEEPQIDNTPKTSSESADANAESLSWLDYTDTENAKKMVEKLKNTLMGFANETINIISTILEEERKHNEEQLEQVKAKYQGVISENNALKQEIEETKTQNISLMQTNVSIKQNINDNYTSNDEVNRMQNEHVEELKRKDETINSVQTENQTLRQQLSTSQNENAALNEDIDALKQSNNDKDQEIQSLRNDITETKQKYDSLASEFQTLKQSLAPLAAMLQSTPYNGPVTAEYQSQPEVEEAPIKR